MLSCCGSESRSAATGLPTLASVVLRSLCKSSSGRSPSRQPRGLRIVEPDCGWEICKQPIAQRWNLDHTEMDGPIDARGKTSVFKSKSVTFAVTLLALRTR